MTTVNGRIYRDHTAPLTSSPNGSAPAVGTVERIDDRSCVLHTGADTVEATLGVHL